MPVVFIVHSDAGVSAALAALIRASGWQTEVFSDAREFLRQPRTLAPACVVMDVAQVEDCGLDWQTLFADRAQTPVIFTAKCPKVRAAVAAMRAGAVDFLPEPPEESMLRTAIQVALDGSRAVLAQETELRELAERYQLLSSREREVMARVIAGRMNKLIADELGISVITVKAHRGKVMRKMKAASLPDLVNMAARLARAGHSSSLSSSMASAGGCVEWLRGQWVPQRAAVVSSGVVPR